MPGLKHVSIAASILGTAVAVAMPAAAGATPLADCADYKKAKLIRVVAMDCAEAQVVIKVWKKLCNTDGLCVNGVPLGEPEEFSCKGKEKGKNFKVSCTGRDSGKNVKFNYPT